MTSYIEYGVKLTDGQKSKLASAIRNNAPLTLRLKHSQLSGPDELMLTKTQISKIHKAISNGSGSDIKISKTQIRKSVKHGGNLFSTLANIGAKVLPFAIKGISKAAPAVATGALGALGSLGIDKIFGKGITIPKKFFPMLPSIRSEFTKPQIDMINKLYNSGKRVYFKPTQRQIEGGMLGTLATIGIPMAIEFVSKMFGKGGVPPPYYPPAIRMGDGIQVDGNLPSNTSNVYVPRGGSVSQFGNFPVGLWGLQPPPFIGNWKNPIGAGVKKKKTKSKGQGLLLGKNSPFANIPILGTIM